MCQGEREMAGDNKLLGQFTLVGIRNPEFHAHDHSFYDKVTLFLRSIQVNAAAR